MKLYISLEGQKSEFYLIDVVDSAMAISFEICEDANDLLSDDLAAERWQKIYDEIGASDAVLVEVVSGLTEEQLIEIGIANALRKRIVVIKDSSIQRPEVLAGITDDIVNFTDRDDLIKTIKRLDDEHNLTSSDKIMYIILFIIGLAIIGYGAAQIFIPLGLIVPIVIWLVLRKYLELVKAFDRVLIYVPILIVWLIGASMLGAFGPGNVFQIAWLLIYWPAVLFTLRKLKFAL